MEKILFISALKGELDVVKKLWKNQSSNILEADFLVSGVGMDTSSIHLKKQLQENKYSFIINIGVCGYKDTTQKCIQVTRSIHAQTQKELIIPVFFQHTKLESILCSHVPVYTLQEIPYVDMESYAVEKICEQNKVPRIIIKVPIDQVGEETKKFNKSYALKTLEKNIDMQKLLSQIEMHLQKLPKKYNIEQYSSHYSLTFSENIIFEKYFHKYTSVLKKDFGDFFRKHKHLEKKKFFETLSNTLNSYSLS